MRRYDLESTRICLMVSSWRASFLDAKNQKELALNSEIEQNENFCFNR